MANCKAIIRAWTVKQSHRGAGIGAWMLKDAILLCLKYSWIGPEFANDHANSVRVLPRRLNGWLDRMENRAKRRLLRDIATLSSTSEEIDGWALPGIL
jgi:dynein heavy chain 1